MPAAPPRPAACLARPARPPRAPAIQLGLLAATIALGLLSRRHPLPGVLAEHTGDALYAVAVFVALSVVLPRAPGVRLGIAAFAVSAAVEAAQAIDVAWLAELRRTRLGALLLGQGFQWADLLAYAIGAAVAVAVDRSTPRRRERAIA